MPPLDTSRTDGLPGLWRRRSAARGRRSRRPTRLPRAFLASLHARRQQRRHLRCVKLSAARTATIDPPADTMS